MSTSYSPCIILGAGNTAVTRTKQKMRPKTEYLLPDMACLTILYNTSGSPPGVPEAGEDSVTQPLVFCANDDGQQESSCSLILVCRSGAVREDAQL